MRGLNPLFVKKGLTVVVVDGKAFVANLAM